MVTTQRCGRKSGSLNPRPRAYYLFIYLLLGRPYLGEVGAADGVGRSRERHFSKQWTGSNTLLLEPLLASLIPITPSVQDHAE